MIGLIFRIIRQMKNDKRTLVLILGAPLLILFLLNLLLGKSGYVPRLGVDQALPAGFVQALSSETVEISLIGTAEEAKPLLEDNKIDAYVTVNQSGIQITMLNAGSAKVGEVTRVLQGAAARISPGVSIHLAFLYGMEDSSEFSSLGYVLLGVLSFFFVFVISGITLVREREAGTLERLMAAPVRRMGVVAGYTAGYGLFAAIQSVLVTLFSKYVLGMEFAGPVALAVLAMVLLALTAVSLGALVSIFANNEFQVMQFIPIVIIPQIFFSGLIPIDTLPYHLGLLSWIMPVYYGCSALESIMVKGSGLGGIWMPLAMLVGFIILLFFLNVLSLRKYRHR